MPTTLDDLKGFFFGGSALKKAAGDAKSSDASSDSTPQSTSYTEQVIKNTKGLPNPAGSTPAPPTKAAPKAKVPKAADALATPGKGVR